MKRYSQLAILLGTGLILLAGFLVVQNMITGYEAGEEAQKFLDSAWAGVQDKLGIGLSVRASSLEESLFTDRAAGDSVSPLDTPAPQKERVLEDAYAGILEIPSLNLTLCIYDDWSYALLRKSPCRFLGISDGNPDRMVISGHNYGRHFGNLKSLKNGDRVLYMNMYGEVFQYTVSDKIVIRPSDIDSLETGDWDIALSTCTMDGRQRLILKCEAVAP